MKQLKSLIYNSNPLLTASVMGVLTVLQIVLTFFLCNQAGLQVLRVVGWIVWALSAVFGVIPIITFRRLGGVPEGKSYMQTTVLVDSGVYAVVRHPQFLAGVLINISLMLIAQHWLIIVLGVPPMLLTYLDAHRADQSCVEKFGDEYKHYMQRVPRINFLAGIIRLVRRRKALNNA
jgi:protein-S-isoprenylcysteine O-methyltransferase Ste14